MESEAAPPSSQKRPTRTEWVRIAIFGIPYATFFLVGVPTWIFPASWSLTAINIGLDTILLLMALAFFGREFFPAVTYLRTRPVRKILLLIGLWFLVVIVQAATRIALYGGNPPVAENQQQVINALNDGTLGLAFSFFVTVGVPLVEEIFYRHILIGKLSAYAPTWLVASISAALFAYMHSHQWQRVREVRKERRLLVAVPRAEQLDHAHCQGPRLDACEDIGLTCDAPPDLGRDVTALAHPTGHSLHLDSCGQALPDTHDHNRPRESRQVAAWAL